MTHGRALRCPGLTCEYPVGKLEMETDGSADRRPPMLTHLLALGRGTKTRTALLQVWVILFRLTEVNHRWVC